MSSSRRNTFARAKVFHGETSLTIRQPFNLITACWYVKNVLIIIFLQLLIHIIDCMQAMTTTGVISALWLYSRRLNLPIQARRAVNVLLGVVGLQATLGISTLIYMVPIELASAHQAGSLTLLTSALWLVHALKRIPVR